MTDTLETLRLPELQALYAEVVGEPTRSPNRVYLMRRIREATAARDEAALAAEREEANTALAAAEEAHDAAEAADLAAETEDDDAPDDDSNEGGATSDAAPLPPRKALMKMPVERLRDLYLQVVGRPSGSDNVAYLVWKIRTHRVGATSAVPRAEREPAAACRVLPLRIPDTLVTRLDASWRAAGYSSRTEFIRRAIEAQLGATQD